MARILAILVAFGVLMMLGGCASRTKVQIPEEEPTVPFAPVVVHDPWPKEFDRPEMFWEKAEAARNYALVRLSGRLGCAVENDQGEFNPFRHMPKIVETRKLARPAGFGVGGQGRFAPHISDLSDTSPIRRQSGAMHSFKREKWTGWQPLSPLVVETDDMSWTDHILESFDVDDVIWVGDPDFKPFRHMPLLEIDEEMYAVYD
ncbi:MAG: hypothetical protein IT462_04910 [Planctomycetes bacterium]|nr:hypothetical protein [Planctomycetota bacterium]